MARPIRIEFENAVYHITARGNERREIFRSNGDRELFLKTLVEAIARFDLQLKAYCLMPNHFHFILSTPLANLSQAMAWLQTTYTVRFNRKYGRSGHLFQGRFKAHLVDGDAYALVLVPYIHLNPVRSIQKNAPIPAHKKKALDTFPWSSHRFYAGIQKAPSWLDMGWFHYWGSNPARYRKSVLSYFGKEFPSPWSELHHGLVLGGEELREKTEALLKMKKGLMETNLRRASARKVLSQSARKLAKGLCHGRLAIWLRFRLGGEAGVDLAKEYGFKDGSAITQIAKRLEKKSEKDPALASQMTKIKEKFPSRVKR